MENFDDKYKKKNPFTVSIPAVRCAAGRGILTN